MKERIEKLIAEYEDEILAEFANLHSLEEISKNAAKSNRKESSEICESQLHVIRVRLQHITKAQLDIRSLLDYI